tara:strand:- start:3325 stop:3561 length:237 start_codon:yes stop_codon:yes gene_type:complete
MNITIEEGLTLNNPTAKIKSVQYEQFNNLVNVEIYFTEEGSAVTHSRNYTFTNEGGKDLVYADVIELVKTNEVLNNFF